MAGLQLFNPPGAGGATPLLPWIDVRTYGAVGDGIADDTAAIQAAIAAAEAVQGTVYLPPGDYVVDQLTMTSVLVFLGAGRNKSRLFAKTGAASPLLDIDVSDGLVELRDFSVIMTEAPTGVAISLQHCSQSKVERIIIDGGSTGLFIAHAKSSTFSALAFANQTAYGFHVDGDDSAENYYHDCIFYFDDAGITGVVGFRISRTTAVDVGGHTLDYLRVIRGGTAVITHAFLFDSTVSDTFFGVWASQLIGDNVNGDSAAELINATDVHMLNSWFTGTGGMGLHLDNAKRVIVSDTWLDPGAGGAAVAFVNGGASFIFTGLMMNNGTLFELPASNPPIDVYYLACRMLSGLFTNDTAALALATGVVVTQGPTEILTHPTGGSAQTLSIAEAGTSNHKYVRLADNNLQILGSAFGTPIFLLQDNGHVLIGAGADVYLSGYGTDFTRVHIALEDVDRLKILGQRGGAGQAAHIVFGTDTPNYVFFMTDSNYRWQISDTGGFGAVADNVLDIGAIDANRPRDFYLGRNLYLPGVPTIDPHVVGEVWSNGGVLTVSAG